MTELKRAVFSWRMVLAVFLVLLILMGPLYTDTLFRHNMWSYMAGYGSYYGANGLSLGFSPFAHIFPMIPCNPVCGDKIELDLFHTSAIGKNSLYLQ